MKFDSSRDTGTQVHHTNPRLLTNLAFPLLRAPAGLPLVFGIGLGEVILGWDEGVMRMSVGERSRLLISADKAYGATGTDATCPRHATMPSPAIAPPY